MTSSFTKAASRSQRPARVPSELVGTTVGDKYRLTRELGHGGMGTVYKAENVAIGKLVALKLLHRGLADEPIVLQRFEREARATVAIAHPNIVDVLDMGKDRSGAPYLVMEYVRGQSLNQLLRMRGPLPVERVARIVGQILAALAAAHRRGIIHRDLKPENILLTPRTGEPDFVKVVDFGISTFVDSVAEHERENDLTPTGLTMATPFYASPEQIRGANGRDPRVDIYAVGVLTYEMLCGRRPFHGRDLPELCDSILAGRPAPISAVRADVPPALEAVVRRALANQAHDRYPLAADFHAALVPFGAHPPCADEPDPTDTFSANLRGFTTQPHDPPARPEAVSSVVHEEVARGLCGYFAERYGAAEARGVLKALDAVTRHQLAPQACQAESLGRALLQLDRLLARGDQTEIAAAGRYFFSQGVRDKKLLESTTPELFFSLSAALWQDFFRAASARVTVVGRGYGGLELRAEGGAPPPLALVVAFVGTLDQGLRQSGGRMVAVRLAKSTARGDASEVVQASWRD